jgi:hypothetical protein
MNITISSESKKSEPYFVGDRVPTREEIEKALAALSNIDELALPGLLTSGNTAELEIDPNNQ